MYLLMKTSRPAFPLSLLCPDDTRTLASRIRLIFLAFALVALYSAHLAQFTKDAKGAQHYSKCQIERTFAPDLIAAAPSVQACTAIWSCLSVIAPVLDFIPQTTSLRPRGRAPPSIAS
jgi:hypothetical protein